VGVGVCGDLVLCLTEPFLQRLQVFPEFQENRRVSVTHVVETDVLHVQRLDKLSELMSWRTLYPLMISERRSSKTLVFSENSIKIDIRTAYGGEYAS
jgi:hypothetical protein